MLAVLGLIFTVTKCALPSCLKAPRDRLGFCANLETEDDGQ